MTGTFVGLLLGVAMGARHALDPDHLAAVSVLTAGAPSARRGAALGALWGVGHAAALLGTGLVLAALAAELPPALGDAFELAVAAMLILLGLQAVRRALRTADDGPAWLHAHTGVAHRQVDQPGPLTLGRIEERRQRASVDELIGVIDGQDHRRVTRHRQTDRGVSGRGHALL